MARKHGGAIRKSGESAVPVHAHTRKSISPDSICVMLILFVTLAVYAPALFGGKVMLPADIVPIMRPWTIAKQNNPNNHHFAQNQLHGPIFEYYSWRFVARESMRNGEIPLWNPYELGGNILLANNQSAVLYPPNVLLYLFSLPTGINLVTALHTFLTGFFMFGLLRTLRLRPVSALTGALAWMWCGTMIVWMEFQTPTAVLCWLPGALWMWEIAIRRGGWRTGLFGTGIMIAMALLAGHLQFSFYVALAAVLYAVVRRPEANDIRLSLLHRGTMLAGALLFGLLLSLVVTLPTAEMAKMNFRGGHREYAESISLRMPPENLLTLLLPNLLGNSRDYLQFDDQGQPIDGHDYFGKYAFVEYAAYPGVPVLILSSLYALLFRRLRRQALTNSLGYPAFAVIGTVGLLLALGTPLCALFYYGAPGYSQFHATARAICLLNFALAGMAAYGVEILATAVGSDCAQAVFRTAIACVVVAVLAGLAAFPLAGNYIQLPGTSANLLSNHWMYYELIGITQYIVSAFIVGVIVALILYNQSKQTAGRGSALAIWLLPIAAALDPILWGAGFDPMEDPDLLGGPTAVTSMLQQVSPDRVASLETPGRGIKSFIVPNYNGVVHLREAQGADSLHTARYHKMISLSVLKMRPERKSAFDDPNTIHVPSVDNPLFDLLNVRYVTTGEENPLSSTRFKRIADEEFIVWENPRAYGRAWVTGKVVTENGVDAIFNKLNSPGFDGRKTAIVETAPPVLDAEATGSPVKLASFSAQRLTADVSSRGRGLLVFSEIMYPGWVARVDNRPEKILTAYGLLRAVPVSPGNHRVSLYYEPASYRVGLYITACMLALLCAIGTAYAYSRFTTSLTAPQRQ